MSRIQNDILDRRSKKMKTLHELSNQFYEEFKGLPSASPIVRNGQKNDAFELVVLKVLYGRQLPEFTKTNAYKFAEYIISPPDNAIDIFFQHESGDESSFDVIQVKNRPLTESELRTCITNMERTIEDYVSNPKAINSDSCREILSKSNLEKSNKNKCNFFVVHTGTVDDFSGSKENERVLTEKSLDILYKNVSEYVDEDTICVNTNMTYGDPTHDNGAVVCSINGYTLAELCNRYFNTEIGRNILFGSNLRESLITKRSKPYLSMSKTITETPENFWYYNNGITIIAKDFHTNEDGTITINGFSIVNGAQTTSALGLFLKEAKKNHETTLIDNLKKVFVLTRILKIPEEKMRQDIAIFNNSQNPITSRDMVANREEQRHLNEWLLDDNEYPQIYAEIRRGSQLPSSFNKGITHRKTTNEGLAQLAYAAFLQKPFMAKDKKSALFNNDYTQSDYVINKIYHDVFNWDESNPSNNGVIFKKNKREIDEVLFVQQLYKESKKVLKERYNLLIDKAILDKKNATTPEAIKTCDDRINVNSLHLDTVGICMFYFIALYYEFKAQLEKDTTKHFNIEKYYSDKAFKQKMVKDSASLFLTYTVKILVKTALDNGKAGNVNNWVRSATCEEKFFDALRDEMAVDFDLQDRFDQFCDSYKV